MNHDDELKQHVTKQIGRMQQAEKERPTLLAQTAYLGTLGLLMVVPVIVGAYLGRWLDGLVEGYSLRWTLSLIVLGVGIGAVNVYLFIKE
ncbi:MAG: ATP synthase subunit [Nitrospirae bacterium RBG_19FT_COMBO_58_9]|nr:MAG: ATP synthase subunit [Nitrospirae bacterium RBG_19FT_COMBO_58_9]